MVQVHNKKKTHIHGPHSDPRAQVGNLCKGVEAHGVGIRAHQRIAHGDRRKIVPRAPACEHTGVGIQACFWNFLKS